MNNKTAEVLLANALNDETCFALDTFTNDEFLAAAKGVFRILITDYVAFNGMTVWGNRDDQDETYDTLHDSLDPNEGTDFATQWRYRLTHNIKLFPED